MDIYYAILNEEVVGLTWACDYEHALSQIELALAEEERFDTGHLSVVRLRREDGTLIFNLKEQ